MAPPPRACCRAGAPTAQTRVGRAPGPRRARRPTPRPRSSSRAVRVYPPPVGGYGPAPRLAARAAPSAPAPIARPRAASWPSSRVVVLFVAAVAVAVTIAASTSSNVVHFRKVVARDASDAVKQLQSLVNQYTK